MAIRSFDNKKFRDFYKVIALALIDLDFFANFEKFGYKNAMVDISITTHSREMNYSTFERSCCEWVYTVAVFNGSRTFEKIGFCQKGILEKSNHFLQEKLEFLSVREKKSFSCAVLKRCQQIEIKTAEKYGYWQNDLEFGKNGCWFEARIFIV